MVTTIIKFPPKILFQQEIVEKGYLFLSLTTDNIVSTLFCNDKIQNILEIKSFLQLI